MQELQETRVPSLGQEVPLEEGMATHSSILAWRIPWTEEPGGLQATRSQRVGHDWSDLACTHATVLKWIVQWHLRHSQPCNFLILEHFPHPCKWKPGPSLTPGSQHSTFRYFNSTQDMFSKFRFSWWIHSSVIFSQYLHVWILPIIEIEFSRCRRSWNRLFAHPVASKCKEWLSSWHLLFLLG